ncbi:MAG: cob(I)yrinic acid a,c-diamide adenosyltransferase [Elusimicrobia bacterium]|nr:cob(I)yrinic acid a,c-diamide adenosyltransferase [Elusimicrobiota bacterium]
MKIYTKVGDGGDTFLFGGGKVRKDHPRVNAYGDIDELNSVLGWAAALAQDPEIQDAIGFIQKELFILGADLATPPEARPPKEVPRIGASQITRLEKRIDALSRDLPPLTHFILPGGSALGAALHLARAVCRRSERVLVPLMGSDKSVRDAQIYINRLSDYLFVLARWTNQKAGVQDTLWLPEESVHNRRKL